MKRYALYALLAVIAWWVIQDPTSAAHFVHSLGRGFTHAAHSLSTLASTS
jgi:hypothetical protein